MNEGPPDGPHADVAGPGPLAPLPVSGLTGFEIHADHDGLRLCPDLVLKADLGLLNPDGASPGLASFARHAGLAVRPDDSEIDPLNGWAFASWNFRPGLTLDYQEHAGAGLLLIGVVSVCASSPATAEHVIEMTRVVNRFGSGVWSQAEILGAAGRRSALFRIRHASMRYDAALLSAVRPGLNDPDPAVREMAVETIIEAPRDREDAAYWEFIQEALHNSVPSVRELAICAATNAAPRLPLETLTMIEDMTHNDPAAGVRRAGRWAWLSAEERLLYSIKGTEPASPAERVS